MADIVKMTPAQKRDKADWELANELMAAASLFMRLSIKAREQGLDVRASLVGHPYDEFRVAVRRDFVHKTREICDARIGT